MKETGIIMSGDHPKLILEGIKTMTRRVIKPQPELDTRLKPFVYLTKYGHCDMAELPRWIVQFCPYGQVGDRLWVRETFATRADGVDQILYKSDYISIVKMLDLDEFAERWQLPMPNIRWKPSIHMFRRDSRILLEITGIRVERLQEITERDAIAESCIPTKDVPFEPLFIFKTLWDSLNAKRGYGWDKNPWVWVISFKLVNQRIN